MLLDLHDLIGLIVCNIFDEKKFLMRYHGQLILVRPPSTSAGGGSRPLGYQRRGELRLLLQKSRGCRHHYICTAGTCCLEQHTLAFHGCNFRLSQVLRGRRRKHRLILLVRVMSLIEQSHWSMRRWSVLKVGGRIDVCDDQGVCCGRSGCRIAERRGGTVVRIREEGAPMM